MNNSSVSLKADDATSSFPSFASLRAAHSELLKSHRQLGNELELLNRIEDFIKRGRATGTLLDKDEERWSSQSLLDYWTAVSYRAGREPPDATLVKFDPSLAPQLDDLLCPYLGLEAFQESNHNLFWGRQRLLEQLIDRLKDSRLLAVVGSSGSGKSSLVLGGLLPNLKAGILLPDSERWHYYPPMVPGTNPLTSLARHLQRNNINDTEWIKKQIEGFQSNHNHLAQIINQSGSDPAVLVIDQFEEVFTLSCSDEERQAFINNLIGLIQSPGARHTVILTMRVDFESQVVRVENFKPLFEQAQVRVTAMDASELREAIEKPANLVGLKFEAGLVEALIHDVLGEPAALPLLQFTLLKLWDNRERNRVTWEAYKRLGGGRQALARGADEFYDALIPEDQFAAKRILLKMVRPTDGLEVTSNRIQCKILYQMGEARDRVERVLHKLIEARLVRLTGRDIQDDDAQVEVAHEALVRNWPRLVEWLDEERVTMRQRLRLRAAAEQWRVQGKHESALWRGVLLDEARRYEDLEQLEAEFVDCSIKAEEKEEQRELETARKIAQESEARREAEEKARQEAEQRAKESEAKRQAEEEARKQAEEAAKQERKALQAAQTRNRVTTISLVGLAGLSIIVLFLYNAARDAEKAAQQQSVRALAQTSEAYVFSNKQLEALVAAVQAGKQLKDAKLEQEAESQLVSAALQRAVYNVQERNSLKGSQVFSVSFSPDGKTLASANWDNSVKLWNVATGQSIKTLKHEKPVTEVSFSPNGKTLASASWDRTVKLWNVATGQPIKTLKHSNEVVGVGFSPNGKTLASASTDNTVKLWDVITGKGIKTLKGHTATVTDVSFSPNGKTLASASEDKTVKLWDVATGKEIKFKSSKRHSNAVNSVSFSPNGKTLASASEDKTVKLWDVATGRRITILFRHKAKVNSVSFSPDAKTLASASGDNTVKLWDIATGKEIKTFFGHTAPIYSVSFSPNGETLASGSWDNTIKLWDLDKSKAITFTGHKGEVTEVGFSSDSKTLVSASSDNTVKLWDIQTGKAMTFPRHKGEVTKVSFSPNGKTLASVSGDNTVKLLDVQTRKEIIKPLRGHSELIHSVSFSPNGRTLASASSDKTVKLWDVATGKEIATLYGHTNVVYNVSFSPNGKTLASASADTTVKLWDVATGKENNTLNGHSDEVYGVSFSPNGKTLASASEDKTIKLWDVATGKEIATFFGHSNAVKSVVFSPDGKTLASASADKTVKLWKLYSNDLNDLMTHSCNWIRDIC